MCTICTHILQRIARWQYWKCTEMCSYFNTVDAARLYLSLYLSICWVVTPHVSHPRYVLCASHMLLQWAETRVCHQLLILKGFVWFWVCACCTMQLVQHRCNQVCFAMNGKPRHFLSRCRTAECPSRRSWLNEDISTNSKIVCTLALMLLNPSH